MSATHDELAGVVDLFGGLTREELVRALSELAFKRGESVDEDVLATTVESAVEEYYLVEYEGVLVPGPTAFPSLPENATDLPHIMDVEERSFDREALAEAVAQRVLDDAATAAEADDAERLRFLLDVTYDVEAWGPVDLADARDRIDVVLGDDE